METGNVCFEYFILLKKNPATLERMKFEKEILAKTRLLAWHFWQSAANRHHIITKSHGKKSVTYLLEIATVSVLFQADGKPSTWFPSEQLGE